MDDWEEIKDVKVGKTDMLMEALRFAVENNVDTVELEVTLEHGETFRAHITFEPVSEKEREDE